MELFLLATLLWGLAAGLIAQMILGRGAAMQNWTQALVAGAAGSFVGGALLSMVLGEAFQLRLSGIIGSVLGAVLLLAAYYRFEAPRTR